MTDGVTFFPAFRTDAVHFLCSWHVAKNMVEHTPSLFKGQVGARELFETKFKELLTESLPPIGDTPGAVDEWFEERWEELLDLARQGLECPEDLQEDGEVMKMDLTQTFEAELNDLKLEDEEEMMANHDDRVFEAAQKKKTAPGKLAWEWLVGMHAKRKQWAHCYKYDHMTFRTFSTQRIESWHSAFKQYMGTRKKILEVCNVLNTKSMLVWNEGAELLLRRREANAKQRDVPIVRAAKGKVSSEALDRFRKNYIDGSNMYSDKSHKMGGLQVYKVSGSRKHGLAKGNYVEATTAWCSRRCELNEGMPCPHMLHACIKEGLEEVPLEQFSGFWREEPEVKPHVHALLDELEEEGKKDEEDDDEEEGATPMPPEVDTAGEPIIPAKLVKASERYHLLMQGNRNLADLGRQRADIFMRAQELQQEIYERLLSEFSSKPKAAAGTGDAAGGVRDPLKANAAGAKSIKRKARGGQVASSSKKRSKK